MTVSVCAPCKSLSCSLSHTHKHASANENYRAEPLCSSHLHFVFHSIPLTTMSNSEDKQGFPRSQSLISLQVLPLQSFISLFEAVYAWTTVIAMMFLAGCLVSNTHLTGNFQTPSITIWTLNFGLIFIVLVLGVNWNKITMKNIFSKHILEVFQSMHFSYQSASKLFLTSIDVRDGVQCS